VAGDVVRVEVLVRVVLEVQPTSLRAEIIVFPLCSAVSVAVPSSTSIPQTGSIATVVILPGWLAGLFK